MTQFHQTFVSNFSLKKRIKHLGVALCTACLLWGCSTSRVNDIEQTNTIRYQSSAGLVNLLELAKDLGYLNDVELQYVGTVQGGPQDLLTLVAGDVDIAGAFNGAVVKVIAADLDVVPVVSSYGSNELQNAGFYVLENSPIRRPRDFIGKKVAMNTFGAHHDFILRDYLARNGLTDEEIAQVEFIMLPPITSEQAMRNGQVDVAVLSNITEKIALKNGGVRKVFADIDLYGPFTAGSYSMRKDFIENNPDLVRQVVTGVGHAHEWLQNTPIDEIRSTITRIINARGRNENLALVPYFMGYGVSDKGGLQKPEDFQPWIDLMVKDRKLKSGQLDAEKIFTNQYNDFQKF